MTQFRGAGVISTIGESRGAFTCRSSTLVVLADSGPFHGQLLTALGSRSDFQDFHTPGCAYVSIINTRSFGPFWPVSWTITHCFGVVVISTIDVDELRGAFTCRSSTLVFFVDSDPFHG